MKTKWTCEAYTNHEYPPAPEMQRQVGAAWAAEMRAILGPDAVIRMRVDVLEGPVPQVLGLPLIEDPLATVLGELVRRATPESEAEQP